MRLAPDYYVNLYHPDQPTDPDLDQIAGYVPGSQYKERSAAKLARFRARAWGGKPALVLRVYLKDRNK